MPAPVKNRWTNNAIAAYKQVGEEMKEAGFKAIREVSDKDCGTFLTFWAGESCTMIQQTWMDTGDVQLYRSVEEIPL